MSKPKKKKGGKGGVDFDALLTDIDGPRPGAHLAELQTVCALDVTATAACCIRVDGLQHLLVGLQLILLSAAQSLSIPACLLSKPALW